MSGAGRGCAASAFVQQVLHTLQVLRKARRAHRFHATQSICILAGLGLKRYLEGWKSLQWFTPANAVITFQDGLALGFCGSCVQQYVHFFFFIRKVHEM